MNKPFKILHLEDKRSDSDLVKRELQKCDIPFEYLLTGNRKGFENALIEFNPDLILSDYALPSFQGSSAFTIKQKLSPHAPFIIVSGTIGEERAVEMIRNGVTDYVLKDKLFTLPQKIIRALKESEAEKAKRIMDETLRKTKDLYALISQVNQNIVRVKNEATLFRNSCELAIDYGKFQMAWIGLFDSDQNRISLVEQSGVMEEDLRLFTNAAFKEKGPQEHILRTGKHFISNNILIDPDLIHWRSYALKRGLNSAVVLPIKRLGKVIGTFNLYSSEINFSGTEEIQLLIDLTNDISFALDLFEKEKIQKETAELIIKNEKQFRALIEQSEDMETLADLDGKMFYASPSIKTVLGYDIKEFLNIMPTDIIHPEDLPGVFENVQKIAQSPGSSFYGEHRLKHKNGQWIWCEGTITNMLQEPHVNAMVSNFRDISEKKLVLQKLEFDTNNLNALINNTSDLWWSIDLDFNLITSNIPFEEMTKTNFGKVLQKGENVLAVTPSLDMQNHFRQLYERAFSGEVFTQIDYFDSPLEQWSEISYSPIRKGNTIIGAACHSRDITERKKIENNLIQSEAKLREAQHLGRIGNWEIDIPTNSHIWSDEMYNIFGIKKGDLNPSKESFLSFIHPDDLEASVNHLNEAFRSLQNANFYFRYIQRDGSIKYGYSEYKFELSKFGKPLRLYGIIQDVTERKIAEQNIALEIRLSKKHQSMLLSSQINPHFIFNALNSVQYFILLKENIESALNFVADFSLLMRKTLTNSRSEFIPMGDELKFLDLYIKLEQQRSPKKFMYEIICDESIHPEETFIPPMLIQPFIENAVIHGVRDEGNDNLILIRFTKSEHQIICTINDNGVGIQKAQEQKKLKPDQHLHQSMGMKITETRIRLLNELYDNSFNVKILDSASSNCTNPGTCVEITLPILDEEKIEVLEDGFRHC